MHTITAGVRDPGCDHNASKQMGEFLFAEQLRHPWSKFVGLR